MSPWGLGVVLFGLTLVGCTRPPPATAQALHNRAAFELGCQELVLVRIDDQSAGVWGCGRRVIYVESCADAGCRWVIEREVPPPATVAPSFALTSDRPHIVQKNEEWRSRIPALAGDEPGF